MKIITLVLDDYLYKFYEKIGKQVGFKPEKVMSDALFKFAGELSITTAKAKEHKKGKGFLINNLYNNTNHLQILH